MAGSNLALGQSVSVEVIRASPKIVRLKKSVICKFCKNKRFWLIRCEYCGRTEQKISLEETS